MSPKISVLVPMYNRKHYIADCINSVFHQSFQDFELIIRDDGSTDGSFEFVQENFSEHISSGKIKLRRNEKNLGEFPTDNKLLQEAQGKYLTILHSDDIYLPHALQHLYETAEKFSADVVHGSYFYISESDVIDKNTALHLCCAEKNPAKQIELVSDDPQERFSEWINIGTFIDAQYNIFKRFFILENNLNFDGGNCQLALWWIMLAKVFVKTPTPCYVYRNPPDSQSNTKTFPPEKVENFISLCVEISRLMDKKFSQIDFFKDNEELQYAAKAHWFSMLDDYMINRRGVYKAGLTPELSQAARNAFKKYFGADESYFSFLFNWAHTRPLGKLPYSTPPPASEKS